MTKRYAIINNDKIDKVVITDEPTNTEGIWIDITDIEPKPWIEWTYQNGIFTSPPPPPAPTIITKLALLNRMTDAEFVGILNAAKTDAEVELWKIRFDTATTIDLADSSRVVAGFPMLVSKGLLTQERSTTILTSPILPDES